MELQVFISELSEFNLLNIDFDSEIADVNVFKGNITFNLVGALVCDVFKCVKKLFSPKLE